MKNNDNRFFEGLDAFGIPDAYVRNRILKQNILMTIYIAFFTLLVETFSLLIHFMVLHKASIHSIRPVIYIYIPFALVSVGVQIYLRKIKDTYLEHKTGSHVSMALFSFVLMIFAIHLSGNIINHTNFPADFMISATFLFTMLLMDPLLMIVLSTSSFLLMYLILFEYISYHDIFCLIIFLIIINLVGAVHYSEAKHRYSNEESLYDANRVLTQMSIFDNLTELKNRNAWRQDFDNMKGQKCFLMICDIDDFKSFNDIYGHATGDLVLKAVADALSKNFGKECCYRFGGDEFIVLSTDHDDDFERVFNKFSNDVAAAKIGTINLHPTISAGGVIGVVSDNNTLRKMLKVADETLYKVKNTGKSSFLMGELPLPYKFNSQK